MKYKCLAAAGLTLACLLIARVAGAASAPDGLEAMRDLAGAGAIQLALRRIDTLQPSDTAAPQWIDWQRLRLKLLAESDRHEELLQQTSRLPNHLAGSVRAEFHVRAAQSALVLGRYSTARDHAGRALWAEGLDAAHVRQIRFLVIRSYVFEGKADEAYRSMLRFQQDYRPLDVPTATIFVDALIDLGLVKEAVNWLGQIEEGGATKLRLRLHTGLVSPNEAIAQARAALARKDDGVWWRVVRDGATRMQSGATLIEAQERLLNYKEAPAAAAAALWVAYADYARLNANTHQLLAGDEASWLDFALRRNAAEPVVARAYLGYLSRHAGVEAVRRRAQDEFAAAFAAAGLSRTAVRIFDAWPGSASGLPVSARHVLGALAEKLDDAVRALDYWNGVPAPIDMPLLTWDVRLSAMALRAGRAGIAADMATKLVAGRPSIPPQLLAEWTMLARQLADHGQAEASLALFENALPQIGGAQARELLSAMARIHDSRNRPLLAADYYLRSALRAAATDVMAADARLGAGLALTRAGLQDDARAQFEWVLQHSKEPSQLEVARRELGR